MTNDRQEPTPFNNKDNGKDTKTDAKKGLKPDFSRIEELRERVAAEEARLNEPTANSDGERPTYSDNLQKIFRSQQLLREAKSKPIEFTRPLIMREADPVIFPNTINVIQGQNGSHKSRLAEILCSVILFTYNDK